MAVRDEDSGAAGLGARALLHQEKLPAGVVGARLGQVNDHLEREDQVAVKVTVQGVPIARAVAEEDRG